MGSGALPRVRLLAESATRVEGDALARLETIGDDDLGELVVWAWVFDPDRTHVLMVDHHAPALVDEIDRVSPEGRPVTTFGAAFVFLGDRTDVLSPEDGQPARWWPIALPPQGRREHLWDWMVEHLALDGPPADGR